MFDPTESTRFQQMEEINSQSRDRSVLEAAYGQVWSTKELTDDYEVLGFLAPFVTVRRKSDGRVGTLVFQHHPRFYFNFIPD